MCGIAGFAGPYGRPLLEAMTERMHHRGPDETGYRFFPGAQGAANVNVGLGHKRLSIIDLSSGQQPMTNEDGLLHVVFNGEIYNHRDLRRDLLLAGHRFESQCDTEVLLHGYEEYGVKLLDRLEGMFAFALWDRSARRWFLARDRFGIKPLYYCKPTPSTFAFASEIKPLLALTGGAALNLEGLYHYLLYGWNNGAETIFRGIFQLRPAHWMTWHEGRLQQGRYWRPEPGEERLSASAWAERVRASLDAAVRSHLLADVPVGITLSGGLDSSSVLALMARAIPAGQIQAFTVGYGLANDELPYARLAANHVGVRTREQVIPVERVAEAFDRIVWHLEEPIAHPVIGTTYFLAEFVRRHVKVALIGEGSDELFAGYPHFHLFRAPYRWAPAWLTRRFLPAAAFVMPDAAAIARFLHADFLDRELLEHAAHAYDDYLRERDLPNAWLRCELEHELVASQLARIDKLTMAHSVEARVPFLDRQVVETALRIPFALKLENGVEKAILRKAMRDLLPAEILHRPKTGPKGTQNLLPMLLDQVLHKRAGELTQAATLRRRGWFRPETVEPYLARADSWLVRRHPIDSRRRTKFLFALATLEQWARLYLDGQQLAIELPRAA